MEDEKIVALYWERNEQAVTETKAKYGKYLYTIAYNVLSCPEDAEECENDTYLAAWNGMPPHRPGFLSAFLGKITRNLSLKKHRSKTAQKRGGGEADLSLEELAGCIPQQQDFDARLEAEELAKTLSAFLRTLKEMERAVFICRYWYCESIGQIAKEFAITESKTKMMLLRTRQKLQAHLEKEGVFV